MKTMTIEELRARCAGIEHVIRDAVQALEADSGCVVEAIHVENMRYAHTSGERGAAVTSVRLDVRLP